MTKKKGREKAPSLSGKDVLKALKNAGFDRKGQRGDHVKMRHLDTGRTAIVPLYDDIADGLLTSILKQAGLSREDLDQLL